MNIFDIDMAVKAVTRRIKDPASEIGTALSTTYGDDSEVFSDFTTKPNGAVPSTFDTGQAFTWTAEPPIISDGAFVTPTPDGVGKATYLEPTLTGKLTRVGAEFEFRRTAPEQTSGTIAMGAWSDPGVVATYPGAYPIAGAHFTLTTAGWNYNLYGIASSDLAQGVFATPLDESKTHTVEIFFDGPTAVIHLPDGTTTSITDARIEQYVNNRPFWEPFMDGGNTDTSLAILRVWADGDRKAPGKRAATATELALRAARKPEAAQIVAWRPSPDQYINLGTTQVALSASLYLDIVIPKSRQFIIEAEAFMEFPTATTRAFWAFTANTSITLGIVELRQTVTGRCFGRLFVDVSGGGWNWKAGETIRIGWSHYKSGADRVTLQVLNGKHATLAVLPANGRVVTAP